MWTKVFFPEAIHCLPMLNASNSIDPITSLISDKLFFRSEFFILTSEYRVMYLTLPRQKSAPWGLVKKPNIRQKTLVSFDWNTSSFPAPANDSMILSSVYCSTLKQIPCQVEFICDLTQLCLQRRFSKLWTLLWRAGNIQRLRQG